MVDKEFEVVITAPPDEGQVAEIWIGDDFFAEVFLTNLT
jgi:hypothetical protein